jgi:NADH-quinone oxidoreductase subunit L
MWLGRVLWKKGDEGTIDRFGPNGLAGIVVSGAGLARRLQSGYVYTYALVMLIGLAAAAAWVLPRAVGGE